MSTKICTWNIKGSNNVVKRKAVLNCLKKDKIQIAYLQETHLNDIEHKKYLREWVGQVYFSSYSTNKRGVAILINKNLPFTVTDSYKDTEGRIVLVKGILYGETVLLGNIYAPNVSEESFFATLLNQLVEMDSPNIILGGDFNCSLCPILDRSSPHYTQFKNTRAFKNIIKELDLLDTWRHVNPLSKSYTFYSLPHSSASRIDYILISKCLGHLIEQCDIGHIALSDHAPVTLVMRPIRPVERSFSWRLDTLLLLDHNFIKLLEEQTDIYLETNDKKDTDPRIIWDAYKAYIRGIIISYASRKRKERVAKQLEMEKKIKKLEEEYYAVKSEDVLTELKFSRAALNDLITRKAEKDILFAKQRLFEFGNKPNKLLARLARKAPAKSFISAVQDENGQRQMNHRQINDTFKRFYEKLYSSETDLDKLKEGNFLNSLNMPQLSNDQASLLEGPITLLEIDKAISSLNSGKSPGADGLPIEFYKVLKGKINKLLLRVFNKSFEQLKLPESMYIANITVILKKDKNPELCSSYRPISLLGVDMKILSKVLTHRLEQVVTHIVGADQTGFIRGRISSNNTRRLINIIHFLNHHQLPGAMVSMDAEKAFDRIELEYLFDVLKRFGFKHCFIDWIKLLYKMPMASVLTNGLKSAPFKLTRGTAQGSPLSPLLFALAIEPLAIAIRQNQNIKGTVIGAKEYKLLLYADDLLLTLTDLTNSIPALIECVKEFGHISGYKVNLGKSEIMPLVECGNAEPPFIKPFRWAPTGLNYLGVKITPKINQLYTENINPLMKHIQEKMISWKNLPISLLGRINLIKMTILPKIMYPLSMLFLSLKTNDIRDINKAMSDFIWAGRKPKIKLDILQLPKERGGWGLPKIENYVLSIHARVISLWTAGAADMSWLEIEAAICKPFSLVNLLDKRGIELPVITRDNFLISNTIKTWNSLRKFFKKTHSFNSLTTLLDNPELTAGGAGPNFKIWQELGIRRVYDLWDKGTFKTFESLRTQYKIPTNDFYKYLQIRHYVYTKMNTLTPSGDFQLLEETLLECQKHKRFVSKFYCKLQNLKVDRLEPLRISWCTLLKIEIDKESWEEILLLPSKLSICNRYREMQYNILQNVYISPYIYSKYTTGASPNCPKCKITTGTRIHCLWECKEIKVFWQAVCRGIGLVIGQQLLPSPLLCLLGLIPDSLKVHSEIVQFLLMLARKAVMTKWVGADPPSIQLWKSLISEVFILERLRYCIDGRIHLFTTKWGRVMDVLDIQCRIK